MLHGCLLLGNTEIPFPAVICNVVSRLSTSTLRHICEIFSSRVKVRCSSSVPSKPLENYLRWLWCKQQFIISILFQFLHCSSTKTTDDRPYFLDRMCLTNLPFQLLRLISKKASAKQPQKHHKCPHPKSLPDNYRT